jgi:hypothetical protein
MGAIAERLLHRSPTAAERNGRALGTIFVALSVEQQDRPLTKYGPLSNTVILVCSAMIVLLAIWFRRRLKGSLHKVKIICQVFI